MQDFKTFDLAVNDGIATVTLNRPEAMNTFGPDMATDFLRLLDATDADDDVRVIIVTGSGKAFCAGADLGSKGATFDFKKRGRDIENYRDRGGQVTLRLFESLKPIICAVNGAAIGIGATMQLAMDIRIASTTARFGFVFSRRGITPEACSSWFLPRLVGMQTALEWCYTGRVFDGYEAHRCGLIRSLHEPEELLPAAHMLAREIADKAAPVSNALIRQMMWRLSAEPHPKKAHLIESQAVLSRGQSADAYEGVEAFLQRRATSFPDMVSNEMPSFYPWWNNR